MKNFGIIFLLFIGCSLSISNAWSQDDARQIYERIIIAENHPIKLEIKSDPIIEQYLRYYQGRGRTSLEAMIFRSSRHEKMIQRIFREEGVPEDLSCIRQIELLHGTRSWTAPQPLWTFSAKMAAHYGLRINKFLDERLGFEKATRATAQYLKFLSNHYDRNWELVLAAYFSSVAIVDRALKNSRVKDYWKIYPSFHRESRNFVPNVLATILIASDPEKYGFGNIKRQPPLAYELVRIRPSIKLEMIAELANQDIKSIKSLNPELISDITPPDPYVVRVPAGKGQIFAERMRRYNPQKSEQ